MPVEATELLEAYDTQLREEGELTHAQSARRHGALWWARFGQQGMVTYRTLGGAEGDHLDALIATTVAHFRDETDVVTFEWKSRGHDAPADLGDHLVAHGLVAEEVETVMVGEAAGLAGGVELPPEVTLRRAGEGHDLRDDVRRCTAMQEAVFGSPGGLPADELAHHLATDPGHLEMWLAEVAGQVVCAGRLDVVPGTDFAGIWGGATLPEWRGRGIYRAVTAARARSALARGVRYLHSDCTEMSRPILERSGLIAVTTTTPYVWTRATS